MARFELRYFFDGASGICLWSANEAANDAFGYAVEIDDLALSESTIQKGRSLLDWWAVNSDTDVQWAENEYTQFRKDAQDFLHLLNEQLGPEFVILDESGTA